MDSGGVAGMRPVRQSENGSPGFRIRGLCHVFSACLLFVAASAMSSDMVVRLDSRSRMIHEQAAVYQDPQAQMEFSSILALPEESFSANDRGAGFGFSGAAFWYRMDFENTENRDLERLLVFETPWMDSIRLYDPDAGGGFRMRELGDRQIFDRRERRSSRFVFRISLPPGASRFFARLRSSQAMMLPISLWRPLDFDAGEQKTAWYFGAVYGAIAVMFLYNFLIFFSTRDRNYLYYCLYLLAFFLMNFSYNGFSFKFFWPNAPGFANFGYAFFIYFFQVAGLLFAVNFLKTREHLPGVHRVLILLMALEGVACAGFWLAQNEFWYNQAAVNLVFVYAPVTAAAAFISWKRGFRAARYFVLASTATLVGTFITALTVTGRLPFSFAGFHAAEFGIILDVTLLALALADRLNIVKEELAESQERALEEQMGLTQVLEHRVDERTGELSMIYGLIAYVNEAMTMEDVLDHIYTSLMRVVPYERIGLALVKGERLEAVWSRHGGESGEGISSGYSIALEGSRLEALLKSGKPRVISDLRRYLEDHPDSESTAMMIQSGFLSSLTCPLRSRGRGMGFLFFTSRRPDTYTQDHVRFLMLIADQLSLIIEKSALHDEQLRLKTSLEEANIELESLARIDALTGLANRRELDAALDHEWRRAIRNRSPISFIMLDIDFFKAYNDSQGHLQGDECLRRIADCLRQGIRRANDFVARYGGEEFGIVLPECPKSSARAILESIRVDIEKLAIPHESSPIGIVTVSGGCATAVPELGVRPEELVRIADRALYQAKAQGRNCVVCADER